MAKIHRLSARWPRQNAPSVIIIAADVYWASPLRTFPHTGTERSRRRKAMVEAATHSILQRREMTAVNPTILSTPRVRAVATVHPRGVSS
jgi:hypothetical protein